MAEHLLTRELRLDRPIEEVFEFFSNAGNLELITPPDVNFHIITPQPIEMRPGTLIDYRLRVNGMPLSWRTEITEWEPPHRFVDIQVRGPYAQWIHTHTFRSLGDHETLIEDEVRYRLPFEPFGDLAHFFVRSQLEKIFDYRQESVLNLLGEGSQMPEAAVNV